MGRLTVFPLADPNGITLLIVGQHDCKKQGGPHEPNRAGRLGGANLSFEGVVTLGSLLMSALHWDGVLGMFSLLESQYARMEATK